MAEIQPGDLILFAKLNGDPLSKLVRDLDRVRWSHCGIALPDGRVANCRTGPSHYDLTDPGGIRYDEVEVFSNGPYDVYRARPSLDADVLQGAMNYALGFGRDGNEDLVQKKVVQQSHFGFVKLFLVSCALVARSGAVNVSAEGSQAILNASLNAARVLSWTWERPYFFCSEFVAAAYGQPFSIDDLTPQTLGFDPTATPLTVPEKVAGFLDRVRDEIGGVEGGAALVRLLSVMGFYERDELQRALDTVLAWQEFKEEHGGEFPAPGESPEAGPPEAHTPLPVGALPEALVTPRMLAKAPWMGEAVLVASGSA